MRRRRKWWRVDEYMLVSVHSTRARHAWIRTRRQHAHRRTKAHIRQRCQPQIDVTEAFLRAWYIHSRQLVTSS